MRRNPDEQFGMTLMLLARLYRRTMDAAIKEVGLSEATILPLRYLARMADGCRQGELADILCLEGPTLVRIIDQLVARDLVERVENGEDRRVKIIKLTRNGQAFNRHLDQQLKDVRKPIFKGIAPRDVKTANEVMCKMLRNITVDLLP